MKNTGAISKGDEQVVLSTIWNLIGMSVPILMAVLCIPILIAGLGTDRFGILTIAWVVMGYFSFFDFGLGRATTKFVSEYMENGLCDTLRSVIWSSIFAHIFLGLVGGMLLFAFAKMLAVNILKIPIDLQSEVKNTFFLLAISVPFVVVTAVFRGLLEAINRFDLVNIVRIPSSVVNYVGPLLIVWFFTQNLVPVVGIIALGRAVVLFFYIFFSFRNFPPLRNKPKLNFSIVKTMLGYGGWLTISNMISPILVSLDRFIIAAVVSVSAVAYYATPYEIVTKLWLFSASLLAVLFPKFSAMGVNRTHEIPMVYSRAVIVLLSLVTPFVAIFLVFGYELLAVWIGDDFAIKSTPVLTWLSIGVLINVLAQVPSTFMQSIGRADIPAKLHLFELPLYAIGIYLIAPEMGIVGVAMIWTFRATIDAGLLFLLAGRLLDYSKYTKNDLLSIGQILIPFIMLLLLFAIGHFLAQQFVARTIIAVSLIIILLLWEWYILLSQIEREWVSGSLKSLLTKTLRIRSV